VSMPASNSSVEEKVDENESLTIANNILVNGYKGDSWDVRLVILSSRLAKYIGAPPGKDSSKYSFAEAGPLFEIFDDYFKGAEANGLKLDGNGQTFTLIHRLLEILKNRGLGRLSEGATRIL